MQEKTDYIINILLYYKKYLNIYYFLLTILHFRCIMNNMDFYAL